MKNRILRVMLVLCASTVLFGCGQEQEPGVIESQELLPSQSVEENVAEENSLALLKENGNNIQVAEDGNYTFVVNADDMSVVISK